MKILIVGAGGREHALAWLCAGDEQVRQVWVAPGNAGTAGEPGVTCVPLAVSDQRGLLDFARRKKPDLVIIGPEQPIAEGLADLLRQEGITCLAPSAAAGQLESSKSYAKDFMRRHGIPTADCAVFDDPAAAIDWVQVRNCPLAIKADGLAAGKGVVLTADGARAEQAIRWMSQSDALGTAGKRIVVEEFLSGREASFIVLCDGSDVMPLATSEDHKARDDADRGPNTGGMGACSPSPAVDGPTWRRIMDSIVTPTIAGAAAEGKPLNGFLYCGLMISPQGEVSVLEYNCRLGDPEAQVLLSRYRGCDFSALCLAAARGELASAPPLTESAKAAVGVVMAAKGYPGRYQKGDVISGLDAVPDGIKVFHAGTTADARGQVQTSGGRVLCVTAAGDSIAAAGQRAYEGVAAISWPGAFWRGDIAARGPWPPVGDSG